MKGMPSQIAVSISRGGVGWVSQLFVHFYVIVYLESRNAIGPALLELAFYLEGDTPGQEQTKKHWHHVQNIPLTLNFHTPTVIAELLATMLSAYECVVTTINRLGIIRGCLANPARGQPKGSAINTHESSKYPV